MYNITIYLRTPIVKTIINIIKQAFNKKKNIFIVNLVNTYYTIRYNIVFKHLPV